MKLEQWVQGGLSSALALCISLGSVGCLASAFEISFADYPMLVLSLLAASVLSGFALLWKRGGAVLLLLGALVLGYLWRRGEAVQQLGQLLYRISYIYDRAYHWGYLKLADSTWDAGVADLPLGVLGCAIAATVAWEVCRGKSGIVGIFLALLPLLACLVVTDTTPQAHYLYLLALGLILLVLTGRVRQYDTLQGCRLMLMALVPTAAVLGLLFSLTPQDTYVNRAEEIRESLLAVLRRDGEAVSIPQLSVQAVQSQEPAELNLATLASRFPSSAEVMRVTAQTGGTLYLRGRDYESYDGKGWKTTAHRTESFPIPQLDLGYVTVETPSVYPQIYLPYYPDENLSLVGGRLENTALYQRYSYNRRGLSQDLGTLLAQAEGDFPSCDPQTYLALPEGTRSRAEEILEGMGLTGQTVSDRAAQIGAYVRSCAAYDLQTQRMPAEAEDFALWFLEEADRGYCVHFATTAAVLLRAAGIEARYVSGYMVRVGAEQTVTVTGENAHAWAEYYEPALGLWLVLEATPASQEAQPEAPTVQTQPAQTQPEQTLPTQPQQTQMPAMSGTVPEESVPAPAEAPWWSGLQKLAWLLVLPAAAAVLQGQRMVRLERRRRKQKNGPANTQALARWQEAVLLAKLLKQPVPESLEELAQKAKFSQHTLTKAELLTLEGYLLGARRKLAQQGRLRKLVYAYGYALF